MKTELIFINCHKIETGIFAVVILIIYLLEISMWAHLIKGCLEKNSGKKENVPKNLNKRKSIHDLIYGENGEGGILKQLETIDQENKSESEKDEKISKKTDKSKSSSSKSSKKDSKSVTSKSVSNTSLKPKRIITPYIELNFPTISTHCSTCGSWSSPTGIYSPPNATMSAAWLTG